MLQILCAMLAGKRRSFRADSICFLKQFPCRYDGIEPSSGEPMLFLMNHYSRPGIPAWAGPMAVASRLSMEMHWAMTSAWTYPDPLRSRLATPLTAWAMAQLARVYGFTPMPPMPPHPQDSARRADAVRRIMRLARIDHPAMGLAPEGMDSTDGRLMTPPPGVGRLIGHLARAGYALVSVGVYHDADYFHVTFGAAFSAGAPAADPHAADQTVARLVMEKIAAVLPEPFR
jgi:hypothetical protein